MQTLVEKLIHHAEATPYKPFLVFWENGTYRVICYREFLALTQSLAEFLSTEGGEEDGPVCIVMQHHPLLHALFIACMLIGKTPAYLPFPTPKQDPEIYFSSHKALFERIRPSTIVTYGDLMQPLSDIASAGSKILNIENYVHQGYAPIAATKPDDIAIIQHSSGTTGLKKGVELTYGQIERQVQSYASAIELSPESVVVSWLPLYHDMGLLTSFIIPLSLGASVVSISPFEWVRDPALLLRAIGMFNGTHTWLPNFAFNHIVNTAPPEEQFSLNSMKAFVSCSEPAKAATMDKFADRFGASGATKDKLKACYAMAETVFAVSQSKETSVLSLAMEAFAKGEVQLAQSGSDNAMTFVSNGHPIADIEVGILTENGISTDNSDVIGEILVRGPFVFNGYYRSPEATEKAFHEGWYKTGDLGFLHDNNLYISGRTKDVIIVHGRNYYSHDIEDIVSSVEGVIPGRGVAIGIDDAKTASEELLILVETRLDPADTAGQKALRREIKKAVFDRLELTAHDVAFVPQGWLVKTTSGKFSRVENLKRFQALKQAN